MTIPKQSKDVDSSLREQITTIFDDYMSKNSTLYPVGQIMSLVTTYIENIELQGIADGAVVDNIKLVVNSDLPAEWTNPVTGKKLYNQAYIEAAEIDARIDEQDNHVLAGSDNTECQGCYNSVMANADRIEELQAQKAVLEKK